MTDFGGLTIGDLCGCTCADIENTTSINESLINQKEQYLFSIDINGAFIKNSEKKTIIFDVYNSGKVIRKLIIN